MSTPLRWIVFALILILAVPVGSNTFTPFYTIAGNSMDPSYRSRNIVFTHNYHPKKLSKLINKVVVFLDNASGKIVIHRVIRTDGQKLRTKGDNNLFEDAFEPGKNNILGIVYAKL